jgi:hypothetical protein
MERKRAVAAIVEKDGKIILGKKRHARGNRNRD